MKTIRLFALTLLACALPAVAATFTVTNNADSGAGSLRQAFTDAVAAAGADTIALDAALSGQTITFGSEIVVSDADGVTVDASALAGGLTLSGNSASRIFTVAAGGNLTLRGLTLTNGTGAGTSPDGQGGALLIQSTGTATVERCTVTGNHCASGFGGAIRNEGNLIMTFSTVSGNSSPNEGGAYLGTGTGTATVTHCTISGNDAGTRGGGMRLAGGSANVNFTILAGNTRAGSLTHVEANHAGTALSGGTNLISSTPLLDALASNGGPTQTMALQAGSAAIDAAVGSAATEDQRGEFLYGVPDIGAYEYKGGVYLVTNNADSGAGSLRQALTDAAAESGADTIEFAAGLSGGTITFGSEIVVDDADGVAVDASALAGGLTLSGGGTTRILQLASGRSLTLTGLTFTNGNGVGAIGGVRGGAINNNGALTLTRCTFIGNACAAGGAIRTVSSLSATDCTFANNTVPNQGGAIIGGTMTLTRCTFTGNSADEGGAVYSGNAMVSQCTFSGNTGRSGAAILFYGTMDITHSTVWGNTVTPPGGTAVSNRSAGGTLTLTNSIVEDIMNFGTFVRAGANIVATLNNSGGTDSGPAAITADPTLGALASNGGPTPTRALLAGSPAIDAAVGSTATEDQRGQLLVGPADLGAYEHPQTAQTITFTNPGAHAYGEAPFALSATATSGLVVNFAIVSGPATVLGDMLTITGAGDVTVRASQAGDGTYNAAPDVDQTFSVVSTVVTTNADSGAGSLREALTGAAALPGANTITLDAALSGQTITFTSEVVVNDADGVTIDASALANGLTLSGGGTARIFSVASGSSLALVEVTLTGGNGVGTAVNGWGGAIYNAGTATLTRCTLSGNTAGTTLGGPEMGGAILNDTGGTITLTQCTLSGNACISNRAGALLNMGTATLTHCTVSANSGHFDAGGIRTEGALTLENTIVSGNVVPDGSPFDLFGGGASTLTRVGLNLVGGLAIDGVINGSGSISNANPLLGALASNGGPTKTMALGAGSAAIDAAVGSAVTHDQRGNAINGAADVGAYEYKAGLILVTNNADSGAGSLRQAVADAASIAGGNLIEFAAVLNGATITFASEIAVSDTDGVEIDASALAGGITLDGNNTCRHFNIGTGSVLNLVALNLTRGSANDYTPPDAHGRQGGSIFNDGTLTASRCSFYNNYASWIGGAIANNDYSTVCAFYLNNCTVANNNSEHYGGGIAAYNSTGVLTHCTVTGNGTYGFGAAFGSVEYHYCIVSGNMAAFAPDFGNAVGPNLIGGDAGLAPLGDNGGPTKTMALLEGSAAIDAATGSTITSDQRGFSIVGTPDLGAYENHRVAQTISFTNPGGHTYGDAPFALSATATSGLTVSFAIVSGPATVLGDTLTITGAGDVTVRASQAGDDGYFAAADVDQTFTVAKAPQTITFPPIADRTYGDAPFAVNATSNSGETVSFLMIEGYSGIAMFDNGFAGGSAGQNVVINGAGHVTIRASVAESANYLAAPDVEQGFTIVPAGQAISFNPPATATTADTILLSATGGASGYPVVFSVESGPGTISGVNSLSFTGPGNVVVRASQAGDANFAAAPDVDRTIAVSPSLILLDDKGYANNGVVYFDVTANDTSTSGAVVLQSVTQPVGGNAKTKIEGGRVRFTPVSAVTGTLTFTYTASNGFDTSTATVTVRPFSVAVGTYVGLMKRPDDTVRGRVVITTTALGQLTGQLRYEGRSHVLKGGVNWTAELAVTGTQPQPKPALLTRGEDDALGQPTFILTVPDSIVGQKITGTAERSPYSLTNPTAQSGLYTIVADLPSGGSGPAFAVMMTCSVTSAGTVKFGGKTGNGVTVTQAGKLLNGGRLPFFVSSGIDAAMQGLSGELVFDRSGAPDVTGTLHWAVPAGTLRLAAGVDQDYDAVGQSYTAAGSASGMFSPAAPSATITLEIPSLGLGSPVVRTLPLTGAAVRGSQQVFMSAPGSGNVIFKPGNGYFSGRRVTTGATTRMFFGVVLQGTPLNEGRGMLLDAAALGEVTIVP